MEPNTPLSTTERKRFNELRQSIGRRMSNMQAEGLEAGKELDEINVGRLYKESYKTFEDFVLSEYNMTARNAYYWIDASKCEPLVHNARQSRPLKGLTTEDAQAVVAVAKASGPLTAAKVKSAKEQLEEATAGLTGAAKAEKQAELINAAEEAARSPAPRERDRLAGILGHLAEIERRLGRMTKDVNAEPDLDAEAWQAEVADVIQEAVDRGRQLVKAAG